MKKKHIIFTLGVAVLLMLVITAFMFSSKNTSVHRLVTKQISISDVNEIKLIRIDSQSLEREEVIITEPGDIRSILHNLNTIQLLKKHHSYIPVAPYRYDVLIQENQADRFGITFIDDHNLEIYDAQNAKDPFTRYEIKNGYNLDEIAEYFEA
ncbi:hypothetical protein ABDI30_00780 [Paenibacillus cisolokensis]|uniref:hypothetical protein n=1 Tax=Paenibacillus cisolokensis TaxID=1658519 RepID=UPI003D2966B3